MARSKKVVVGRIVHTSSPLTDRGGCRAAIITQVHDDTGTVNLNVQLSPTLDTMQDGEWDPVRSKTSCMYDATGKETGSCWHWPDDCKVGK